jgi:hypothetical protein
MTSPSARRLAATATFLLLSSIPVRAAETPPAAAAPPAAEAKETGELWEVTSQMSMEGMPISLPAQTRRVCAPKEWKEPPGATDERQKCRTSDFKKEGPKASWKVRCAGPPEMTGDGEITRDGADSYSGAIKFASSDANMTVKLSGRRVGACDAGQK